jgi:hypothetical protein
MDSLLAGTLILPKRVHCAGNDVQRRRAFKNIPGIAKTIPGSGENRSPSRRNRCSPSARNPVRLHPGIVFAFTPESFSPCPGIRSYSIDTQIMVWGWDPQMTMTVRANQGYSWVPSYGQSNIAVGPGLSMPGNPNSYSPGNPPAGAIEVSTAFAVGTIQNPLVQTDPTSG